MTHVQASCSCPKYSLGVWGAKRPQRPSRLATGQRRDKRLAPQALNSATAANWPTGLRWSARPAPSGSPPPSLSKRIGEGLGVGATTQDQEDQQ
jgi:hypothetical protein